jgi:hypothetical protein
MAGEWFTRFSDGCADSLTPCHRRISRKLYGLFQELPSRDQQRVVSAVVTGVEVQSRKAADSRQV